VKTRAGDIGERCAALIDASIKILTIAVNGTVDQPRTDEEIAQAAALPAGEAPVYLQMAAKLATAAIQANTATAAVEREAQRMFDAAIAQAELAAARDAKAIEAVEAQTVETK